MKLLAAIFSIISTACFAAQPLPPKVVLLTESNHVALSDEITPSSVTTFLKTFLSIEENNRMIFISSPGGSVPDGMRLVQVIQDEKSVKKDLRVTCYVDQAASMAFALLQAICDDRLGGSASTLMQHQASYGVQGSDNQILSRIKMITSIIRVLDNMQAKRIGITVEELRRRSADEWWTVGQEAVDAHVLDRLAPAVCHKDLISKRVTRKFMTMFGSGSAVFSKCPLLTGPVDISMDNKGPVSELVRKLFEPLPLSERVRK